MQTGDNRGAFYGLVNTGNWKETNVIKTNKGEIRGNHYHKETDEVIFMLSGKAKVLLIDVKNPTDTTEIILDEMEGIIIQPYTLHKFEYLEKSIHIAFLNKAFDPKNPDLHFLKLKNRITMNIPSANSTVTYPANPVIQNKSIPKTNNKSVRKDFIVQIYPWIGEAEKEQLERVIASTFLTEHKLTKEFETMVANYTKSKYVVATNNGSSALYTGLFALGVGQGDEVIVPNFTFVASCNAIILTGAKPVFCEVDSNTFCIDPTKIEALITPRTKAIMPVHIYGQSADMTSIMKIARKHNLKVIEDAAQAIGVQWEGEHVGLKSDLATISFYGNKTITCGEGGIVLTQNKEIAEKIYRLKNHGRPKRGTFIHDEVGYNFSITEMQAAIGIAQMNKLPAIIKKKQQIADRYVMELGDIEDFQPVLINEKCSPVYWFTSFLTLHRKELATYLKEQKIQTRKFFCPLHHQPCYADIIAPNASFPVSEKIYNQGISLPSAYGLTDEEQDYVIDRIKTFFGK